VLGVAVFQIPAGKTARVQVGLLKNALKRLRQRRQRRVVVEVRTLDPTTGKSNTVTKTLKLVIKPRSPTRHR
jgi:hypothetical protein